MTMQDGLRWIDDVGANPARREVSTISVVIPTYRRGIAVAETTERLLALPTPPDEIVLVDQTERHPHEVDRRLMALRANACVKQLCLNRPSIPAAMNYGVLQSSSDNVLFLDDDIIPAANLISAHCQALTEPTTDIVTGQVIQPWEVPLAPGADVWRDGRTQDPDAFRFNASRRCWVRRVMAGNLSISRRNFLDLGGFDENFVAVAYRFEAEFADRAANQGLRILFEPEASIRHLKLEEGGTRSYGHHLNTWRPNHAVGRYYYALTAARGLKTARLIARGLVGALATNYHLRRPWWIPVTLLAEISGLAWAVRLALGGPKYITGHRQPVAE